MKIKKGREKDFKKFIELNSDFLGKGIVDYAIRWAELLETQETLSYSISETASSKADINNQASGTVYGAAKYVLFAYWYKGDQLKEIYEKHKQEEYQRREEYFKKLERERERRRQINKLMNELGYLAASGSIFVKTIKPFAREKEYELFIKYSNDYRGVESYHVSRKDAIEVYTCRDDIDCAKWAFDELEKDLRKCPHFCEYCGEIVNTEDEYKCVIIDSGNKLHFYCNATCSHKGFFENKISKGGLTNER